MNKISTPNSKKIFSLMIVVLFIGNFFSLTITLSFTIEGSSTPIQDASEDFNPYNGLNCTKLGEYDSNYGQPLDMFIAEHSTRTLSFIIDSNGILILDITQPENPLYVEHLFQQVYFYDIYVSDNLLFLVNSTDDLLNSK